ncbi:hypothetical protein VOLCADRAFT_87416 [Volvox carteri f. nagariensis]|uniref:Uncharacterized protein n=1 Tax=Volvox carteri f. nagariensis TaxID=3068 RepID=D8TLA5_VOLCA|nr:uncharacterized protein VOLCADRAFT_87416 [Volvox carteri f. nagariensis]EFJ51701.1 hypothetical protein VOLCADRAFT_87416 [Volvox carteri f. nagariensis]|eukprot:XP_002947111.1 hypothetical protein VOLCADRAFT_87416 [Volvox carteri f. nagariensis]
MSMLVLRCQQKTWCRSSFAVTSSVVWLGGGVPGVSNGAIVQCQTPCCSHNDSKPHGATSNPCFLNNNMKDQLGARNRQRVAKESMGLRLLLGASGVLGRELVCQLPRGRPRSRHGSDLRLIFTFFLP